MQRKIWISGLISFLISTTPLAAQSCLDKARVEHPNAPATQALFCVEAMQAELDAANAQLAGINRTLKNAVLAFNRSEKIGGACPRGWSLFEAAGGRMIVGAGEHPNGGLSEYPSYADDQVDATGGEEIVKLSASNLPPHIHSGNTIGTSGMANTSNASSCDPNGYCSPVFSLDKRPVVGAAETSTVAHNHTITTDGGNGLNGEPHNNMPPYIALYFCKKD